MSRKLFKSLGAGAAVLGMLCSMASVAGADDFATDAPAVVTETGNVKVWVVAVPNEVNGDVDHGGCNVGGAQGNSAAPHVVASITSSDDSVATVSDPSLQFDGCGEANGQSFSITLYPDLCVVKTATITIAEESRGPGNSVKGEFSTETINVSVAPSNPADPACGGNGGGGGTQLCAEPAAPAWANALLKASGLKGKQAKDTGNYVSGVAHQMTNGAVFEGVAKSNQDAYANAVRTWMMNKYGLSLVSVNDARVNRPGWSCGSADQIAG